MEAFIIVWLFFAIYDFLMMPVSKLLYYVFIIYAIYTQNPILLLIALAMLIYSYYRSRKELSC